MGNDGRPTYYTYVGEMVMTIDGKIGIVTDECRDGFTLEILGEDRHDWYDKVDVTRELYPSDIAEWNDAL